MKKYTLITVVLLILTTQLSAYSLQEFKDDANSSYNITKSYLTKKLKPKNSKTTEVVTATVETADHKITKTVTTITTTVYK